MLKELGKETCNNLPGSAVAFVDISESLSDLSCNSLLRSALLFLCFLLSESASVESFTVKIT